MSFVRFFAVMLLAGALVSPARAAAVLAPPVWVLGIPAGHDGDTEDQDDRHAQARARGIVSGEIIGVDYANGTLRLQTTRGVLDLTVLPGTLEPEELAGRLRGSWAAAVMKIGRSYPGVRAALKDAGRLEQAYYVERASSGARQVIDRAADVDPSTVPYMSLVIIPGAEAAGRPAASSTMMPPRSAAIPGRMESQSLPVV